MFKWIVSASDIDFEWNVAVCNSKKAAKNLVSKLEAEQEAQADGGMLYAYHISTVPVHYEDSGEEDED